MTEFAASGTGGAPPSPEQMAFAEKVAQAFGTTETFGVAIWMMVAATLITVIGLSVKHEELATDPPEPVAEPETVG